jgi:hypothetical protein
LSGTMIRIPTITSTPAMCRREGVERGGDADTERDREVLEASHGAEELLRVAEPVQESFVVVLGGAIFCRWAASHSSSW